MVSTLTGLMEEEGDCILAVSHGGASFNFMRGIGADMERFAKGVTNCCIFILEYENGIFTLTDYVPNPVNG